jgi:hypothetical protein
MQRHSRRSVLKAGALGTLSAMLPRVGRAAEVRTVINDASRLNPTLRGELKEAAGPMNRYRLGALCPRCAGEGAEAELHNVRRHEGACALVTGSRPLGQANKRGRWGSWALSQQPR